MACVLVPLAFRFLRFGPADLGLLPDGRPATTPPRRPTVAMSRTALLRDGRFVTVSVAFAVGLFAQIGVYSHFLTRVTPDLGLNGAAAALSLTTICAVLGRTALGWTIGAHGRRVAATANFVAQAAGVLFLSFGHAPLTLILGCILFGLGVWQFILPATPNSAGRVRPRRCRHGRGACDRHQSSGVRVSARNLPHAPRPDRQLHDTLHACLGFADCGCGDSSEPPPVIRKSLTIGG